MCLTLPVHWAQVIGRQDIWTWTSLWTVGKPAEPNYNTLCREARTRSHSNRPVRRKGIPSQWPGGHCPPSCLGFRCEEPGQQRSGEMHTERPVLLSQPQDDEPISAACRRAAQAY